MSSFEVEEVVDWFRRGDGCKYALCVQKIHAAGLCRAARGVAEAMFAARSPEKAAEVVRRIVKYFGG